MDTLERFAKLRDKRDAFHNNQEAIKLRQAEALKSIEHEKKMRIASAHLTKFGKNAHLYEHLLPKEIQVIPITNPIEQIDISKVEKPKLERKRRYRS